MLIYFLFVLASLSVWMYALPAFFPKRIFSDKKPFTGDFPFVSILISARNESENIEGLCRSLSQLSYPKPSFEILIGNDASTDDTLKKLRTFAPENATIVDFTESLSVSNGKLAVLKRLTREAKGEFLLFTDADVELNPHWVQGMIYNLSDTPQMQLGITRVKGSKWLDQLQNMDWLLHQSLISWTSENLMSVTAWGNNMSMGKMTFEKIGGYEGIETSVVEDVDLMRKLVKNDGRISVHASPQSVVWTAACPDLTSLFQQRLRWARASKGLNHFVRIGLLIKAMFFPIVIFMSLLNPWYLLFIPIKACFVYILLRLVVIKIDQPISFAPLLFFELYEFVVYLVTFVMYLFSFKVKWKGRNY